MTDTPQEPTTIKKHAWSKDVLQSAEAYKLIWWVMGLLGVFISSGTLGYCSEIRGKINQMENLNVKVQVMEADLKNLHSTVERELVTRLAIERNNNGTVNRRTK